MSNVLKPFQFHGVVFTTIPEDLAANAKGNCSFCGKQGHFYVNQTSGQWDCKRCGSSGNVTTFLEKTLEQALETTTKDDYLRIRSLRGNICHSSWYKSCDFAFVNGRWIFPCYTLRGTVQDLRTYVEGRRILGTQGCKTGLWGAERLVDPEHKDDTVWVCEGEWDGIALAYVVHKLGLSVTVVAVPGAVVFKQEWVSLFNDRNVILAYDADKAGDLGMQKVGWGDRDSDVRGMLADNTKSLQYVRWPLDLRDGYDVSDQIKDAGSPDKAWLKLSRAVHMAPRQEALVKSKVIPQKPSQKNGKLVTFNDVVKRFNKWFEMTQDAVMALRVIFSVVFSNQMAGDPLWVYVVSPPGSGKTALLNPLRSVPDLCVFRSSLTTHALVSGYQSNTDPSLIPKCFGKTLVLKDMTEILSAPMHVQEEVFSTLRGAYDGLVERSYGNAVFRRYEGYFSFLAGVTVQIHGHSRASMGERMLKFQLIPHGKINHEAMIRAAMRNTGNEDERDNDLYEVVAGFLDRKIDVSKLQKLAPLREGGWAFNRIVAISQLIAKLRTEVERDFRGEQVKYRPQDEVATRLGKQLLKLAMLLSCTSVDASFSQNEWQIVERVAFDTAIGWNLDVVQAMMMFDGPVAVRDLIDRSGLPRANISRKLEDLLLLKVIQRRMEKGLSRNTDRVFYTLTPGIRELWKQAGVETQHVERVANVSKGRKVKIRFNLRRRR